MKQNHEAQRFADVRDNFSNTQVESMIAEWINDETDRQILKSRLIDGLTYKQLADNYHLCERQIKNRIYKAQEKLFKHLNP